MTFSGHSSQDSDLSFRLEGANIIDGFRRRGYQTIGSGAVEWFNTSTETGSVLSKPFEHFFFAGNTWSLSLQLEWIEECLLTTNPEQPRFVFLNVGETHVPYWHDGASWDRWPSPCIPFGGDSCSAVLSSSRQRNCLEWVDTQLANLLDQFKESTILICSDHGDCWGEDGLREHGISHPSTLTVPLIMRVRGQPIISTPTPSRFHNVLSRLRRFL
ncbi:sulfatase-like hydrolase/transferase [Synechococcus sp. GEYO]|uniref:sulfatase-like hydrolase/transferase n=1 Tax=Synechococcus sp. GEYO TaxID=2575511 RepID=UPI00352C9AC8